MWHLVSNLLDLPREVDSYLSTRRSRTQNRNNQNQNQIDQKPAPLKDDHGQHLDYHDHEGGDCCTGTSTGTSGGKKLESGVQQRRRRPRSTRCPSPSPTTASSAAGDEAGRRHPIAGGVPSPCSGRQRFSIRPLPRSIRGCNGATTAEDGDVVGGGKGGSRKRRHSPPPPPSPPPRHRTTTATRPTSAPSPHGRRSAPGGGRRPRPIVPPTSPSRRRHRPAVVFPPTVPTTEFDGAGDAETAAARAMSAAVTGGEDDDGGNGGVCCRLPRPTLHTKDKPDPSHSTATSTKGKKLSPSLRRRLLLLPLSPAKLIFLPLNALLLLFVFGKYARFLFGHPTSLPAGGAWGQLFDDLAAGYVGRRYRRDLELRRLESQSMEGGARSAASGLGGSHGGASRHRNRGTWAPGDDDGNAPSSDLDSPLRTLDALSAAFRSGQNCHDDDRAMEDAPTIPPFLIRVYDDAWTAADLGRHPGGNDDLEVDPDPHRARLFPVSFHPGHVRDRLGLFRLVEEDVLGLGGTRRVEEWSESAGLERVYRSATPAARAVLWAVACLYLHGGIVVGGGGGASSTAGEEGRLLRPPEEGHHESGAGDIAKAVPPLASLPGVGRIGDGCGGTAAADAVADATPAGGVPSSGSTAAAAAAGYAVLPESRPGRVDLTSPSSVLAASPRHPHLGDLLRELLLELPHSPAQPLPHSPTEGESGGRVEVDAATTSPPSLDSDRLERALWRHAVLAESMYGSPVNKMTTNGGADADNERASPSWVLLRERCRPCDELDDDGDGERRTMLCCDVLDADSNAVARTSRRRSKVSREGARDEGQGRRETTPVHEGGGRVRGIGMASSEAPSLLPAVVVRGDDRPPPSHPDRGGGVAVEVRQKVSLHDVMLRTGCAPSWICNRCLHHGHWGSPSRCSSVCSDCFVETLCSSSFPPSSLSSSSSSSTASDPVVVRRYEVAVNATRIQLLSAGGAPPQGPTATATSSAVMPPPLEAPRPKLIPRIIHQTWFEDVSEASYPHMVRLQNSWRASGWDYRFYDDASARQYIVENYPRRFVDAFDVLLPGAFKADLFRYLVLLVDGGVYADIDMMLETTLETLIHPNAGFIVPLDSPGEILGERFCLWNGFMGAAPGHPFLARAVERTVNLILTRADLLDMESEICRSRSSSSGRSGPDVLETWKTRTQPGLLLSGPCGLGVSVNEAIGRDPLARFELGWMKTRWYGEGVLAPSLVGSVELDPLPGDTLILQQTHAQGTLQLIDPERNLVVASTQLSFPHVEVSKGKGGGVRGTKKKEKPHYSSTNFHQWMFGSRLIYADKSVTNERVELVMTREE